MQVTCQPLPTLPGVPRECTDTSQEPCHVLTEKRTSVSGAPVGKARKNPEAVPFASL